MNQSGNTAAGGLHPDRFDEKTVSQESGSALVEGVDFTRQDRNQVPADAASIAVLAGPERCVRISCRAGEGRLNPVGSDAFRGDVPEGSKLANDCIGRPRLIAEPVKAG